MNNTKESTPAKKMQYIRYCIRRHTACYRTMHRNEDVQMARGVGEDDETITKAGGVAMKSENTTQGCFWGRITRNNSERRPNPRKTYTPRAPALINVTQRPF